MIEIKNLKKAYPNVTPIKNISTVINKGDVISIIGPSGTGKSTLLRCINLLETPTEGEIIVDGVCITDPKCDISKVRQKMGMVFQSFNLFEHKTIIENIMLGPVKLLKKTPQEAYDKGMELLRTVGLANKAMSFPDELSGGQKQRVAIVRTLAMDPEVVLFDEPTSALDPTMVGEVLAVMRTLAKQNLTMMVVTHEMKFARDVCNRVFYMDEGGIYEDGPPEQIFDHPIGVKTRQFINKLKVFTTMIDSKDFDFMGFNTSFEEFAAKNYLSRKMIVDVELLIEEICVVALIPQMQPAFMMEITMEYSEEKNQIKVQINYNGKALNPLELADDISLAMIKNIPNEIIYRYEELNKIEFLL